MSRASLISLDDVAAGHGRHAVISGVNLQICRGAFCGVLGPNGAGKTTLLKTIAGILPPIAGQITSQSLHFGYVPQRESLESILPVSALEVALMGICGRVGPGRFVTVAERTWAWHCLDQTGVGDLARQSFARLSGGQKQRVLISRALVNKPELLLLDEPTVGIDAAATETILDLLGNLHTQGITILMVNHDFPALRRSVNEVIWIHEGTAIQGPASEMLNRQHLEKYLGVAWE